MKISGFTIIRNAIKFDFPIVESISSALDFVDEFIVVMGDNSDETEALIRNIPSSKIKIIKSDWDTKKYHQHGNIYAHQTDIALHHCAGDWCLYLQADEVLQQDAGKVIIAACNHYLEKKEVEGFLLKYIHFFGAYDRYVDALHFAYPLEIRIVRNHPDIHSWSDAQSFRMIPGFNHENYAQKEGTRKLNCVELNAYVYHYGWCRDPRKMVKKVEEQQIMHDGVASVKQEAYFDYGNLSRLPVFKGKHPDVMRNRIEQTDWLQYLRYTGTNPEVLKKQFRLKYRILTFIENKILGGRLIAGFKNYKIAGKFGFK
ncbi:glycosyltransferase [Taibaiella lutea]|uniref:Glycosyltransferase n=1 Tax=Taibaiella lutea TaxID=2608001 RepID=A0A5M6CQG3_9BACT|nr:glycosyltransferase family 2 protein [Taibaiella lutea]KAA5537223.1 glycosyltransferase [Taibaiella lutea]